MTVPERYLAFDLGAESGRAVVGELDGERLTLADAHRFATGSTRVQHTLYWDVLRLFSEMKRGLQMAAAGGHKLSGIGIDTWGVDFGLLGRGDVLLGNPRHYRDHGNDGMMEEAYKLVPSEEIFRRTGIQRIQFNTVYQLLALKRERSPLLDAAETLLLMPDLLNFWLSGEKRTEYSIASTTQMIDPARRTWDIEMLERLGLPTNLFAPLMDTASQVGWLRADISTECGAGRVPVYAPAEHDTGSAIVAVPASSPDYAYISSGTWSLMGIETDAPVITAASSAANFTNEGGAMGTTRLLKNIMGLWLVQECRRSFSRRGDEMGYTELTDLAEKASPHGPLVEPDNPAFLSPADMVDEIARFCTATGQEPPRSTGAIVRCCLESLALKYRWTLEQLTGFRGADIDVIHIVGGGCQNRLLCQLAANATRRKVVAGPVEATALGNILMQAAAAGRISSLSEARAIVRASVDMETYEPQGSGQEWDEAYGRFTALQRATGHV